MKKHCAAAFGFFYSRALIVSLLCSTGMFLVLLGFAAEKTASVNSALAYGGANINLITGPETSPHLTQSTSAVWAHGNTIVVVYDDSSGATLNPSSVCGVSTSTDGGSTFLRLPEKFNTGGACYGDPDIFFSVNANAWFATNLAARCGGAGAGVWTSPDGLTWSNDGCAASGSTLDFPHAWVDNNTGSPFYGTIYVAYNNFDLANFPVQVTRSTDNGSTWSATTVFSTSYRRSVDITGSLGTDGTVFVETMDEGGGGFNMRQNFMYRSTDGGATWSEASQGAPFSAAGRALCSDNSYFACMYASPGYWRHQGFGQAGVGPGNVVHYAYTGGAPSDPGNIYYVRSTDSGSTWSAPLQLNSDATTRAQWGASLSVNAAGDVFVSWYDERDTTTDSLERFGRLSTDNGATWAADLPVSDVIFPKPLQPDSSIQASYAGSYDQAALSDDGNGNIAYHAWTDGRVAIAGSPQQDVFLDKINVLKASAFSNISTRALVQTGNNVVIAGFIITGSGNKQVVLRALGPTLGRPPFNVPGALANPTLTLYRQSTLLGVNDNWGSAANAGSIPQNLRPPDNLESAILVSLAPGSYTAIVRGAGNTTGVGLAEVYDLDSASDSSLSNISTRAFVQTGNNVMIAGVIVQGISPETVLIRALGPTLAAFNVPNVLANPTLELHDGNGTLIQANDNWKDTQQSEIAATGKAPPNDFESAILQMLAPGNYTAIVRGRNNTVGNALAEVYELP